ncbi:hypothetical protein L596_012233 [Steinernema carpocapsae]|uniref:Suppressor of white apricot N-terminal domain-containing protein n=1 Tax=Steinernema carpocapsae TaxID=34508 RepID=A0A4U5NXB2_STECR|nr:hypothetical protein L596_012233 [Steinernema carpocapsae]
MWHEARKQEKKVKSHMVDAVKRNERRRQYYESVRRDPEQFMQVHGRKCHIHVDPAIAQAAESSSILRKWQGNPNILIDRFDARSHLDFIPEAKQRNDDDWDSTGLDEEEARCDYERYRILVSNEYKKVGEKQCLKEITTKEFWSESRSKLNHRAKVEMLKKKELADKKAAIGFSYDGEVVAAAVHSDEESDHEPIEDGLGFDLKLDVRRMGAEELSVLNKIGQQYRVGGTTFIKLIKMDQKEQDEAAQIKEIDKAKLALSGRQAKADRAILKRRRAEIVGKTSQNEEATTTLLSFIAKRGDDKLSLQSSSSEDDRSHHQERTEFIRSFGGDKPGERSYDRSPTRHVVQGPVLPSEEYRKILALKRKRSPSPLTFMDEPSSSRKGGSPKSKKRGSKSRSRSPKNGSSREKKAVDSDYNSAEDAPLEVRSSMSESEKERTEIDNRKRMIRRTKRMAHKNPKASRDPESEEDEKKSIAARKLRQQMQRALTKTADELKAEEDERMSELRAARKKRDEELNRSRRSRCCSSSGTSRSRSRSRGARRRRRSSTRSSSRSTRRSRSRSRSRRRRYRRRSSTSSSRSPRRTRSRHSRSRSRYSRRDHRRSRSRSGSSGRSSRYRRSRRSRS